MPTFESPEWFILIPAFLFAGWFWPKLGLLKSLRLIIILLVTLLLANPQIDRLEKALDLWVLLDRSDSTEDLIDVNYPGWKQLLDEAKPSRRDQLKIMNYASEVLPQGNDETEIFTASRTLTRTNLALQTVLSSTSDERPSRVLLFTDGFSTEPLNDIAEKLAVQGIPLDYRIIRDEVADDFRISSLSIPERSQLGEPFVISIGVRGHTDGPLPLQVFRDDELLTETEVTLVNGAGRVEFTDRLAKPGAHEYRGRIVPEKDAHPGNNQLSQWTEIVGGPRILLLTNYTNDPLAAALAAQGFTIDLVDSPEEVRIGQLAGARACILNNVAAHQLPNGFLEALDFFVRDQAGGLLMAGGETSFGAGGYYNSPIDDLLPVSMELKNEHRKLTVAMAIVMDRSGSMGAGVAGGAAGMTKMDLANSGAASAIELLGAKDYITVIAVDSEPHTIIPLVQIKNNKRGLMTKTRSVKSSGGGIYTYTGLDAAWKQLKSSPAGTKHIILFSDAADSEEPGRYKELLQEMQKENATVSVIGLGSKTDPDAAFLEDIAKRGNGRMFFTNKPLDLPQIFAQETVSVARSAFLKDPVRAQATGQWSEISPEDLNWPITLDGYNLSYLRPEASIDLVSADEYAAPLVSHIQRGFGRTMAVSFPLGGEFSEKVRSWDQYGDFAQTFTRWLMGLDLPPGIGVRHKLEGTRLTLDLLYDPEEWNQKFAEQPPIVKLLEGDSKDPYEVTWKRLAPGHFSLSRELDTGSVIRGSIQVGSHAIPFGPLTVSSSAEWIFDPSRLNELKVLSAQSGGRELLDLSSAWVRPPVTSQSDFRLPLTVALLLIALLEILISRTGWSGWSSRTSPAVVTSQSETPLSSENPPIQKTTKPVQPSKTQTETPPTKPQKPAGSQRSRFERAKRKK